MASVVDQWRSGGITDRTLAREVSFYALNGTKNAQIEELAIMDDVYLAGVVDDSMTEQEWRVRLIEVAKDFEVEERSAVESLHSLVGT